MSGTELRRADELAERFEEALARFLADASARGAVPNLHDAMSYALGMDLADRRARGKRIRPALCLAAAEALGAEIELALPFAVAIELMHNFCLVHDDLEDGDAMRRGRPAVWKKYGMSHAINTGDYMLVQCNRALAEWGSPRLAPETRFALIRLLAETLDQTHLGQAMDINARGNDAISMDEYLELVRRKTGYYLAAPIEGGAIVAGADGNLLAKLRALAAVLGPMFQIMDDLIDLTEGKGRDAAGSDIGEGKRSYMVAHAAAQAGEADRRRMFEILNAPRETTKAEDVAWTIALFEQCGAMDAARAHCARLREESRGMLAELPAPLAAALGPVFDSLADRAR